MPNTTPAAISNYVTKLCESINPSATPVYVPVEPERGAVVNFCFASVVQSTQPGKPLVGWILWELTGAMVEAEMHAVLERPDGTLVDIVPKLDGETSILFLPDPAHPMAEELLSLLPGLAPPNHRMMLKQTPLLKSFQRAARDMDAVKRGTFKGDERVAIERFARAHAALKKKYP